MARWMLRQLRYLYIFLQARHFPLNNNIEVSLFVTDLVTTSACMGVFQHRRAAVTASGQGKRPILNYVAFSWCKKIGQWYYKIQISVDSKMVSDTKCLDTIWQSRCLVRHEKHWTYKVVDWDDVSEAIKGMLKALLSGGISCDCIS